PNVPRADPGLGRVACGRRVRESAARTGGGGIELGVDLARQAAERADVIFLVRIGRRRGLRRAGAGSGVGIPGAGHDFVASRISENVVHNDPPRRTPPSLEQPTIRGLFMRRRFATEPVSTDAADVQLLRRAKPVRSSDGSKNASTAGDVAHYELDPKSRGTVAKTAHSLPRQNAAASERTGLLLAS